MSQDRQSVVAGRGVVKTFKDFWGRDKVKALREVDIDVPEGSIFGLLGPNGAGKSTLIKLILGHLYPTSGQLAVFGKSPRDVNTKFKIGYLPERSYLYKNLTAEETLSYFGEILNLSREQIQSRTEQLLEMVGLHNVRKRFVGEFSHGMTRRMGLAQALLNDPEFVILDEPTAGLDPVGCREVKDLILTLGKRGKTILLTSHLLADVEDVCDDMMVIFGGAVQAKGSMDNLLADTNRMKLEFPAVDEKTLSKVKGILGGEVNVSSPRQSLESYFLQIVNEGNEKQETSGASKGAGVAEYLRQGVADDEKSEGSAAQSVEEKSTPEPQAKEPESAEPAVKEEPPQPVVEKEKAGEVQKEEEPVKTQVKEPEPAEPESREEPQPVAKEENAPVKEKEISEQAEEKKPVEVENGDESDSLAEMKASAQRPEEPVEPAEPEESDDDDDVDEDLLDKLSL